MDIYEADRRTPEMLVRIEKLSMQERKLLYCVRSLETFSPQEASRHARAWQHNQVSVLISRIVRKGEMKRMARAKYALCSDLREWLLMRQGDIHRGTT